ncbi:MAG TPA: peptide chain release factor 2 [Pseudogracilibacillus sp.]|nr:peptide chain release factor 2 [Pseudogracilibacillus sp.]
MDLTEIKQEIDKMDERITDFRGSLDLDKKRSEIANLEEKMTHPGFWDDNDAAQTIIHQLNSLKSNVERYEKISRRLEDSIALYEMVKEENDEELIEELDNEVENLIKVMNDYELEMLLSEPYDANNAILELHPGAGGTESQDWASIMLRMYQRWAEKRGFKVETLNYIPGDEAGVKSVTLLIKGHNAYGYLKSEKGVHRLVRISPFDSSGRRHTSFVSCEIAPEMPDNVEIEINTEDIHVDTYRASGAGGQHVNTTDSAVRIIHEPTGTVVTSQQERSQLKNRDLAMKMLKSKLYQLEIERQEEEVAALRGEQKEIGWGSQIRSYIFHPYSMVKDHRYNLDIGNAQGVIDGNIDPFIDLYLRSQID